eukprot:544859_1
MPTLSPYKYLTISPSLNTIVSQSMGHTNVSSTSPTINEHPANVSSTSSTKHHSETPTFNLTQTPINHTIIPTKYTSLHPTKYATISLSF